MMTRIRSERGIALAVAIFALVVVGGLVSAAFFVAVQEQRIGRNTVQLERAFTAADGGVNDVITNWSPDIYNQMSTGGLVLATYPNCSGAAVCNIGRTALPSSAGWYRGSVRKINDELFLVTSEGFNPDSTARQSVGVLVRLKVIEFKVNSALKSQGTINVGGSSSINGTDQTPTGWTGCPTTQATKPGIRVPVGDSSHVTTSGACSGASCIVGSPQKIFVDSSITDSSLSHYGDATFDQLKSMANKFIAGTGSGNYGTVQPSLNGAACNNGDDHNWGEPDVGIGAIVACSSYFPIIWIEGSTHLNGNRGQGILIVNGDLTVTGGFNFYGPVIVKGSVNTMGTGGHFNGGVIARNVSLQDTTDTILGNAVINYSSCALFKALNSSGVGAPMRERGWANIFE